MTDLKKSVADGKTLLINTLSAYETNWSATWNSENASWANIRDMITITATSRYNSGRTQGQTDVTSSPNSYSLYTAAQYSSYGTSRYNAGVTAGKASLTSLSSSFNTGTMTYGSSKTLSIGPFGFGTKVVGVSAINFGHFGNGIIANNITINGLYVNLKVSNNNATSGECVSGTITVYGY